MVERAAGFLRAQRPGHRRGPLGGGCRLQPVHAGGRDRRPARGGRPARKLRQAGCRQPTCATSPTSWNDQIERWTYVTGTDLCAKHRRRRLSTCASRRPTWPTRPRRRTASCRSRTGRREMRRPPGSRDRQPRRAGAGPLRAESGRRSAHRRHRQGHRRRCCAATCRRDPSGTATTATAMASTPTARPSTAPASAAPGRLLTGERAHYELAAGRQTRRRACWRRWKAAPAAAACCPSRCGTAPTCRNTS